MPDDNPTRSDSLGHAATGAHGDPGATQSLAEAAETAGLTNKTVIAGAIPPVSTERYELGAEIARGGMGVVYRAVDTALGREVAVKVLQDKFGAGSGAPRRFADEARITGQLQHPAIPPVHDVGTLPDGRPFLVMKLIKGDTLAELLLARRNPGVDRDRFVAAFEQVCQALAYAHAHDVIHRDLKPANVMVGNFGEVQVMDWGLAKVLGSRAGETSDPNETAFGTAIQSLRESDGVVTQAGSVLGTPAFMPPEQAIGAINKIDARSDVFGLGAVLAVILTGKPPFESNSVETTRLQAAQGNVEECFARLDASGAEQELVSLCKRCLSKNPGDRPADAGEVAKAVAELRAAANERARLAGLDRATAEARAAEELNTRREAEARADAEHSRAEEQRKRRRVQLALAGLLIVVAIAGGVAAYQVQQDRLTAEKTRSDEKLAAEDKRQADLWAANEAALAKQRQARADGLVQALESANTSEVKRIIDQLNEYRDLTGNKLRSLAAQPATGKPGLHGRLALLADEPQRAAELAAYSTEGGPDELQTIRAALTPYTAAVSPGLWAILTNPKSDPSNRVRVACVLAGLTPDDKRWTSVAAMLTDALVDANPVEFVAWSMSLEPVRRVLVPELLRLYPATQAEIESRKLDVTKLAGAVRRYDLTANLLAQYAKDNPADLAELALISHARHYSQFAAAVRAKKGDVALILKEVLAKEPPDTDEDAAQETYRKRRGYAAAALLALGEAEPVWPEFVFPKEGDPTARSYLQERLTATGADPMALVKRFGAETDVSAKRALLITLGDLPADLLPVNEREPCESLLLQLYREHPDPGLHSAIDWLLRQKWGKAKDLAAIDASMAREARGRVAARAVAEVGLSAGAFPALIGSQLAPPRETTGKDWFVNGEGQTFTVIRGPLESRLGSPVTEPGRFPSEVVHHKWVRHSFAIATKEVTVAEFTREFRKNHQWTKRFSPDQDTPIVTVTWYDCAAYCNWLSAREGIPLDQWCYKPNKDGEYGEGMSMKAGHLALTGYRLPTEAEWECACRAAAGTARHFGRGEGLLPRYGWSMKTSGERSWPVGQLRPNDWGLFDTLGNAVEWCEDPFLAYVAGQGEDAENKNFLRIDERVDRVIRGGSYTSQPPILRCAYRNNYRPSDRNGGIGFRPVRTLPR